MQRSSDALTRTPRASNSAGMWVRQAQAWRLIPRLVLMTWLAALAASQAFLPSAQAGAGPCRVPSNAYPTIQAAVNDATCATINVAAGTYPEHVTIARDVMIRGAGQDRTVVDGGRDSQVFTVAGGTVTIKSVTIQNGRAESVVVANHDRGGGIWNAGTLTVENSTIADNFAIDFGGGIWNAGTLTVENSTIADNRASFGGGGINNSGMLTVKNSTIADNRDANSGGGGISNAGTLTIENSTILSNTTLAWVGGGIWNGGTLTIENSTIADNSASNGGGIWNGGTLTIENSTIADNSASNGGGIFNNQFTGGMVTLTDVTFQNNIPNDCTGCPGLL